MVALPKTPYQRLLLPRTSAELRRDLEKLARRRIDLNLATSRRTVLSSRPQPCGRILLRAHPMFLFAPETIVRALAKVLANPLDRGSSKALDDFIAGESDRLTLAPNREKTRTRGRFFDLREVYRELQAQLFEPGEVQSKITWGRGLRGNSRSRSIIFGSYTPGHPPEPGLIRIHPALDQDFIPRIFVELVVYHEMVHEVVPSRIQNGRRIVHSPEFRARERLYPHYEAAMDWERRNLHRFLRVRPRPEPGQWIAELDFPEPRDDQAASESVGLAEAHSDFEEEIELAEGSLENK